MFANEYVNVYANGSEFLKMAANICNTLETMQNELY